MDILYAFKKKGLLSQNDYDETINVIKEYRITDNNIFEVILKKTLIQKYGLGPFNIGTSTFPKRLRFGSSMKRLCPKLDLRK